MNKQHIIEELKKGNQKLLTEIYIKYKNQFIAYGLKRYPVDAELLKEIYQDLILAFYRNILEGKLIYLSSSVKSYLFEIGKHMIFKQLRSKNFDIQYSDNVREKYAYIEDSVNEEDEKSEVSLFIKSELEKLGEKCFKILLMFYFEKKKMDDIAAALNFSNVDSAKTQKYKCFERLKASVKSNFPKNIVN
jgi:RNA polymerase sigma factor (sigma-70 family)